MTFPFPFIGTSSPAAPGDLDDYFSNIGGTSPFYGQVLSPPALYDSASDTTWIAWESMVNGFRAQQITGLDHATGYWSEITGVGISSLVDDDHGNPAICLDHEGHMHAFYGSHNAVTNSESRHSSTQWPISGAAGEGSLWAIRAPVAGAIHTYPKPNLVGTVLYVFFREGSGSNGRYHTLYKTTALADGVATWDTAKRVIDFGATTRVYTGSHFVIGTEIHFLASLGNDGDTLREHVYYFIYETADGSLKNWDKSVSTASGSLPISLATANTSYRIVNTGGNHTDIHALCFDTTGNPHVVYIDGTGTSFDLKHIKVTAGVWSSAVTVETIVGLSGVGHIAVIELVALSGDRVELFYPLDSLAAWDRGGDMMRRERSAAGVWGTAQTVLEADSYALGRPFAVLNGRTEARVIFCEIAQDSLDASGGDLRSFVWGSGGLIPYQAAPDVPVVTTPDGAILLSGDAQSGTDKLLTSGDMQSGTDKLQQSIEV